MEEDPQYQKFYPTMKRQLKKTTPSTAPLQTQFSIGEEVELIVVPNSCFSVLFVSSQYAVQKKTTITLDIHNNEFNEEISGEWIKLKYLFNTDDYDT